MAALASEQGLVQAFDIIDDAFAAKTTAELDALIARAFARYGVSWFSVDQMRDAGGALSGVHHFGKWPDDWGAHYLDRQHYLNDWVVRHAMTSPRPMHWREAKMLRDLTRDEQGLFGEAGEFGLRDGFVTPLHLLDGAVASVSLTASERLDLSPSDAAALRLLSIYYCSFGLKLKHEEERAKRVHLTPRQRECLQWARAGKSSWEIGEIIGIAERTVNFHIEEACKRLNVQTRQQAVIEAVVQGIIAI